MQQIHRRTPMPKCDFNKVTKQLYWSHISPWVFSCKFGTYFRNIFFLEHLWRVASACLKNSILLQYRIKTGNIKSKKEHLQWQSEKHKVQSLTNTPILLFAKANLQNFSQRKFFYSQKCPAMFLDLSTTKISFFWLRSFRALLDIFPFYSKQFIESCVCSSDRKSYISSNCALCKDKFKAVFIDMS